MSVGSSGATVLDGPTSGATAGADPSGGSSASDDSSADGASSTGGDPPVGCDGGSIVQLAAPGPVYHMDQIPFSGAQGSPFADTTALPTGHFVVAGALNIAVGQGSQGTWLGAGQYVLTDDGALVGVQDIAYDAHGSVPNSCGEGVHFQSTDVDWVEPDGFVRTPRGLGVEGAVFELPPLHYRLADAGVELLGSPPVTPTGINGCHLERNHRTTAIADGLMIAVEEVPGGDATGTRTVLLSLDDFSVQGEATTLDCEGQAAPRMTPLVGVGPLVVARTHEYTATNPLDGTPFPQGCVDAGGLDVYRVDGGSLQWVQALGTPSDHIRAEGGVVQLLAVTEDHTLDAFDPDRVAIAFRTFDGPIVRIYRRQGDALALDREIGAGAFPLRELALAGPYLARLDAGDNTRLVLEEDGVALDVPPPPPDDWGTDLLTTVGLSATRTMLLGQRSQLVLYALRCP